MVCSKCGLDLPLSEFYKYSRSPTGYKSMCKRCADEPRRQLAKKWNEIKRREKLKIEAVSSDKQQVLDYLASCRQKIKIESQVRVSTNGLTAELKAKLQAQRRQEHPFTRESFLQFLSDGKKHKLTEVERYFGVTDWEGRNLLFVVTTEKEPLYVNGCRVVLAEEDDGRLFLWKPFEEVSA